MKADRGSVRLLSATLLATASIAASAAEPSLSVEAYRWRNVQMVGGGFVTGFVFHPSAAGVRYARTDMGGAYRWDDSEGRWLPLLDWVPYRDRNLMGVESIALDPSDANRVYMACGTYTRAIGPHAILRSADRGRTWQRTDVPFRMGGNENGRGNGERLAVDPRDGRVLFMGTRHDGLWTSEDRGVTWRRVSGFPDIGEPISPGELRPSGSGGSGIFAVVFDPISGAPGRRCSRIVAGVSLRDRESLFLSNDGGMTWHPIPDQPIRYRPTDAVRAADGTFFFTYGTSPGPSPMLGGGVWKWDPSSGEWFDVTPDRPNGEREFGYAAVAVDPQHPRTAIVSTFLRPEGDEVFRTIDGGQSWNAVFESGGILDDRRAPYVGRTGIHWLFDLEIDPADPDHALFTTGYGGHETFNLRALDRGQPTRWQAAATGIEETVALELMSPPSGAHLVSAIGDYGGFVHWDLDFPQPAGNFTNPHFGNTDGIAGAALEPSLMVRVGVRSRPAEAANIGYSVDGGHSWRPAGQPHPYSAHGHISVSSNGGSWVWTPEGERPHVTLDRGASWIACEGLEQDLRVTADRVNPKTFYALDLFGGRLFTSIDGGRTFSGRTLTLVGGTPRPGLRGDPRGGQDRLYATPGAEGDLWIAAFDGLHHSRDGREVFDRIPPVQEVLAFGFGRAAPNRIDPAIFLVGVVAGDRGIFRSDDSGRTWVRINDDQHQWGQILHITGDPKRYGRVYVGTHGRGIVYGDPADPDGETAPLFRDPDLPDESRITDLIARMTLTEKIDCLAHSASVPRLGVRGSPHIEGYHGVAQGGPSNWGRQNPTPTTQFPQAYGLGSTWDPDVVRRVAAQEAEEARFLFQSPTYHRAGLIVRAPNADLARDPRWGRTEEVFGEDPYHAGILATAFTEGLQGNHPRYWKTAALLKHFLANSNEDARTSSSSDFDHRLWREYYAKPFEMAIRDGGANAMMAAYNAVNGIPAHVHPMLREIVMDEWGLDGILCTDGGGLSLLVSDHQEFGDRATAAAACVKAGINHFLDWHKDAITEAIRRGILDEGDLDQALRGLFRVSLRLGLLDPPERVPYSAIGSAGAPEPWNQPETRALVREVTQKSVVLLKNSAGLLPLDRTRLTSVTVIGPLADTVHLDWYSGTPPYSVSPREGIENTANAGAGGGHRIGVTWVGDMGDAALEQAAQSDVAVVCVGNHPEGNAGWSVVASPAEGKEAVDRRDIKLPPGQEDFVRRVVEANPRTIVVLITGFPVALPWAAENASTVLHMTHASQELGNALGDVIFGDAEPGGRLAQTWPASVAQLPPMMDYDIRNGRTYMYSGEEPQFAFGYGLSYTTFEYSNLRTSSSRLSPGDPLDIVVDVANTGERAGEDIVQLYVRFPASRIARPKKALRGFRRVHLVPGEARAVRFSLSTEDLVHWQSVPGAWEVESGPVEIMVGRSSRDTDLSLRRTVEILPPAR